MPKVNVGDLSLNYEIMGEGSPVLLVTGIGADSLAWAFNAPALMGNHKVVTVDNRDIGLSDKAQAPYTMEAMGDDTIALLKELDLGPVHFVGHSLGGMIAQQVALKAPELLKSLMLVTSIGRVPAASELLINHWVSVIEKLGMEGFCDFVTIMTLSGEYIENNWEIVSAFRQMMLAHLSQNPIDPSAFRRQGEASQSHDVLDRLKEIKIPTKVVGAGGDILVPPRFSEQIAQAMPDAEYVLLENIGHGVNVENPDQFNAMLLEWFQRNE